MSNSAVKEILKKYQGTSKDTTSQLSKNQKTIKNYKTRIAAEGIDPDEELDKRNWFEKWANLTPDQNAIFDIFELINRPQQALFTGWKNAQEGKDFWEGAKEGFKGNEETQFKDILMNTGEFDDTKGKLDLVDVLGFAGDVFLDPADIIPVAGFGKIDDALDAGQGIRKALKQGDSLSDLAFKGLGKGIKGGAKLADTGLEKVLKNLDEVKGVRAFDKAGNVLSDTAKIAYGNLDNSRSLLPKVLNQADLGETFARADKGRLQAYKELKNSIEDVFKKSKSSVNAILNKRAADNTANEVQRQLATTFKQNEDKLRSFLTKKGIDPNNVDELGKVGEDVSLFIESMMDRSIERDELLDLVREGKIFKNKNGNQIIDELEKMKKALPEELQNALDLSIKVDDAGKISLGDGWNKKVLRENGVRSFKDLDPKHTLIADYGNWYEKSDLDRIEELRKDEDFRALINDMFGEIKDGDKLVIDPLSDNIKVLHYPESQRKWEELNQDMLDYYRKQGYTEDEIMENIRRKNIWDGGTEGGGYVQTSNSFKINDKIRKGEALGGDTATVEDLDKFISGYKSPEDIALLRRDTLNTMSKVYGLPSGLNASETAEALKPWIGKPVEYNKAFTSTAVGEGAGYFDYRDVLMTIKAPEGSNMFVTNAAEREAILKRGQQMILRNVQTKNGELLLTFDLYDGKGRYLATIGDNKVAKGANQLLDEGFGTNFGRFGDNTTYLPHTLADKSMVDAAKAVNAPILRGNTSLLEHRSRLGSIRENNNLYREAFTKGNVSPEQAEFFKKYPKLFEENFNKAFANKYFDGMTSLAKQHKIVSDTLIGSTFGSRSDVENLQKAISDATASGNKNKLKKLTEKYNTLVKDKPVKYLTEFDSTVPNGFTKITAEHAENIRNHLKRIRQAVGADAEGYNQLLKAFDVSKGSVAVNNDVLRMLEVTIDPKQTNALINAYDKMLNLYRSSKTLSFTNNINNFVGNSNNLYLSGIGPLDQAKYMSEAVDISKNGEKLYTRLISGDTLNKKELEIANKWKSFIDTGFGSEEIALDLQDVPEFMRDIARNGKTSKKINAKDVVTAIPRINMRANTYVDNLNRITVMLKSMDDPSYLKRLGIEGATDTEKYRKAISKVMFDPTMMTDAERNVLKKIIPFYTYTKNNLVFQLDNLGRNGSKYNKIAKSTKALRKIVTDGNDEDMADYIKENFYIPIPGIGKNGEYTVLKSQLPFSDVVELTDNPTKYFVNKVGPIVKSPVEYATNTNSFTGREIEKYPGEKSTNIPFLTKKQEKLLGDLTGLDVPIKTAVRTFSSNPLSSITMTNNVDTDKLSRSYEQIEDLQNLMKQYEQKGYQFSTMSELKKANQNTNTTYIDAILAKYGIQ